MTSSPLLSERNFKMNYELCFVVMPFDQNLKRVYQVIDAVIKEYVGWKCIRADEIYKSAGIMEDIWTHINEARLIIADLTGRNPNVFYEVGLAHARHRPIILLTQNIEDVPFDLRGIRCIPYNAKNLKTLSSGLRKYLKEYATTIPKDWSGNYAPADNSHPFIKITSLDVPEIASIGKPFTISVKARNNGTSAGEGYFNISFPSGIETDSLKVLSSNTRHAIGKPGDHWCGESVVLSYPIVEGYNPNWSSTTELYISVSACSKRKGLLSFYVSASAGGGDESQWKYDPENSTIVDQRNEPVYCGVMEII